MATRISKKKLKWFLNNYGILQHLSALEIFKKSSFLQILMETNQRSTSKGLVIKLGKDTRFVNIDEDLPGSDADRIVHEIAGYNTFVVYYEQVLPAGEEGDRIQQNLRELVVTQADNGKIYARKRTAKDPLFHAKDHAVPLSLEKILESLEIPAKTPDRFLTQEEISQRLAEQRTILNKLKWNLDSLTYYPRDSELFIEYLERIGRIETTIKKLEGKNTEREKYLRALRDLDLSPNTEITQMMTSLPNVTIPAELNFLFCGDEGEFCASVSYRNNRSNKDYPIVEGIATNGYHKDLVSRFDVLNLLGHKFLEYAKSMLKSKGFIYIDKEQIASAVLRGHKRIDKDCSRKVVWYRVQA